MRMLNKENKPETKDIISHMGEDTYNVLTYFENELNALYNLNKELVFPFGNNYGWGYKYSHGKTHLFHIFFERGEFNIMLQIGSNKVDNMQEVLKTSPEYIKNIWKNRYPCGERGGYINLKVNNISQLPQILKIIFVKKRPIKK